MKKEEKVKLLKKLESYVERSQKLTHSLMAIGHNCEGKTIRALDDLCTEAIDIAWMAVGDEHGWVNWMVWDNDFGKKAHDVTSPTGKKWKVKTWGQLVDVMEDGNE